MGLLNYTTVIKSETTIAEVETMLAKAGATKILKEYDPNSNPDALVFEIDTAHGPLPFRLPLNLDNVMQTINDQTQQVIRKNGRSRRLVPEKFFNDRAQAARVGWRIIRDWVEAQLALIEINKNPVEQLFLPYLWDVAKLETLYDKIARSKFKGYLLESGSN